MPWVQVGQITAGGTGRSVQGPPGPKGQDAPAWLSGTAPPSFGQGKAGDFYLQTDLAFEPVVTTKLIPGPPGPQGPPGAPTTKGSLSIVHNSGNVTISNSTATAMTWDTLDTGTFSSATPTKLFAPVAGWYLASAWVHWDNSVTNLRKIDMRANGATFGGGASYQPSGIPDQDPKQRSEFWFYLAAGGYVECILFQSSGGNLNITEGQMSLIGLGF